MARSCNADELRGILERLAGQKAVLDSAIPETALSVWSPQDRVLAESGGAKDDFTKKGLGISQLNELLLLVVRKVDECARLVKAIIRRMLEFRVTEEENGSILLREALSGSVFRVLTGDAMLMNAFWNFYLEPSE